MRKKDRSPAMQFYFRQFSGDEAVQLMDLDSVGAHILLMCAAGASQHGFKFAYDNSKLKRLFRNPPEEDFNRIMSQLLEGAWKVSPDGEWLIQEGMHKTLRKQKEFSKKQSENAKKRWATKDKPEGIPEKCQSDAKDKPSSSSSSSSSKKEEASASSPLRRKSELEKIYDARSGDWLKPDPTRALKEWIRHRKQIKKPITPLSFTKLLAEYQHNTSDFIRNANHTIKMGWQGLRAPEGVEKAANEPTHKIMPTKNHMELVTGEDGKQYARRVKA